MEIEALHYNARQPVTVLRIRGDIGAESSGALLEKAQEVYQAGARHLLLDLSEVGYMSSAGLKAIHQIFMLLRPDVPGEADDVVRKGIASGVYRSPYLRLLNPNRHVSQTLRMAGYDMFLETFTDLREAIAAF